MNTVFGLKVSPDCELKETLMFIKKGPFEALCSGVFAASAGVCGKLSLDTESRSIVVDACHRFVDAAVSALEESVQIFAFVDFDVCQSNEVRKFY